MDSQSSLLTLSIHITIKFLASCGCLHHLNNDRLAIWFESRFEFWRFLEPFYALKKLNNINSLLFFMRLLVHKY